MHASSGYELSAALPVASAAVRRRATSSRDLTYAEASLVLDKVSGLPRARPRGRPITTDGRNHPMKRDKADLLEHLDELIEENQRIRAGIYYRGEKDSREYVRQSGTISGLQIARQAVADWIEEENMEG